MASNMTLFPKAPKVAPSKHRTEPAVAHKLAEESKMGFGGRLSMLRADADSWC